MEGSTNPDTNVTSQPFVRLTGVLLAMHFQYFNYHGNPDNRDSPTPICILTVKPEMLWSSLGNENFPLSQGKTSDGGWYSEKVMHYRYGIRFQYEASGQIYKFDFFTLVNALATGAILLGTVGTVVTLIAYNNPMARMAKTYSESFNKLDKDSSGYINRENLFEEMLVLFRISTKTGGAEALTDTDIKVLCEFLMREAELNAIKDPDKFQHSADGRISLEEWVQITTGDSTSYNTLVDLIHSMEPEERQLLLDRFSGSVASKEEPRQTDPLLTDGSDYGAVDNTPL